MRNCDHAYCDVFCSAHIIMCCSPRRKCLWTHILTHHSWIILYPHAQQYLIPIVTVYCLLFIARNITATTVFSCVKRIFLDLKRRIFLMLVRVPFEVMLIAWGGNCIYGFLQQVNVFIYVTVRRINVVKMSIAYLLNFPIKRHLWRYQRFCKHLLCWGVFFFSLCKQKVNLFFLFSSL